MITTENIKKLTEELNEFISHRNEYIMNIGKGVTRISGIESILKTNVVNILKEIVDTKLIIKASVGQGRTAKQPWVVIRHPSITTSTQKGVYIAFLFSKNLDKVFLTLTQGITNSTDNELDQVKTKLSPLIAQEYFLLDSEMNKQDKYGEGTICAYEWGKDAKANKAALKYLLEFYMNYVNSKIKPIINNNLSVKEEMSIKHNLNDIINKIIDSIRKTGLIYDDNLVKRLIFSLLTKPFVILSGLAGSGKTQLILALAKTLVKDENKQICFVSVGADWTNREPLLGYPNSLKPGEYIKPENGVLDMLIECNKQENADKPYFLILDEMNLSVVERYFSDFLSAMESHEKINLWNPSTDHKASIPYSIILPKNLFIIGTINVDETTYMFSPKVLDRASVIEFKVSENEMNYFLNVSPIVDIQKCNALVSDTASLLIEKAVTPVVNSLEANETLTLFFKELKKINAEFGYRTASEIGRFITLATEGQSMSIENAIDASIMQKLLPKLHGSRKKIVPVLKELWKLCGCQELEEMEIPTTVDAKYQLTADKVLRMYNCAIDNGFTSYAEA